MKKERLFFIAISAAVGAAYGIIGNILFKRLTQSVYTPVGIAIYFLLFVVIVCLTFSIMSFTNNDMSQKDKKRNFVGSVKLCAIVVVLLTVFSGLFEFLYELGKSIVPTPTSYVFLIDDSGSMSGTEANRVNAIKDIMTNEKDVPYSVYEFDSGIKLLKGMGKYNVGDENSFLFESDGGTDILGAVSHAVNDIKKDKNRLAGKYPRIILLSDGASSHSGLRRITADCRDEGVSICSVGFGACDESFLEKIATLTGGTYVYCDNASSLGTAMKQAINELNERNLLSERYVFGRDGLYCFLRLLFLTILSLLFTMAKYLTSDVRSKMSSMLIATSILTCTVGNLLIEFLSRTGLPMAIIRLLFCVLWAVTLGEFFVYKKKKNGLVISESDSEQSDGEFSGEAEKIEENGTDQSGNFRIEMEGNPFGVPDNNDPFSGNSSGGFGDGLF